MHDMRCGFARKRSLGFAVMAMTVIVAVAMAAAGLLAGCSPSSNDAQESEGSVATVEKISAEEARDMMASEDVVVLDVRRQDEYEAGHIPDARLLTLDAIDAETAAAAIPGKESAVIVYCRTGVRSAEAAQKLAGLRYEHVYDMGGIASWPYETTSGSE